MPIIIFTPCSTCRAATALHGLIETLQTQKQADFQRDSLPGVPPKPTGDECTQLRVKKNTPTQTNKLLLDGWKQTLIGTTKARTKHELNFLPDHRGGKRTLLQLPPHSEDKNRCDQGITASFPPAESTPGHNIAAVPWPWDAERAKLLPLALLSRQRVSDFKGQKARRRGCPECPGPSSAKPSTLRFPQRSPNEGAAQAALNEELI